VNQEKLKWGLGIAAALLGALLLGRWALSRSPFTLGDDSATSADAEDSTTSVVASCDQMPNGTLCGQRGSGMLCVANDCITNVCGDSIVADGEECDDGNHGSSDGCSERCRWEPLLSCGNGVIDAPEECDDGNTDDFDRCTVRCTLARCGDGAQGPGEACDDGNVDDTDECTAQCRPPQPQQALAQGDAVKRAQGDAVKRAQGAVSASSGGNVVGAEAAQGSSGSPSSGAGSAGASGANTSTSSLANVADASADKDPEAACDACREKHCRNVLGADILAGCLESINSAFGARPGDPEFLQQCSDVVTCARETNCAYRAERQAAPCYCGSISVDECEVAGPAKDAPCVKEWQLATRSAQNMQVLQRFTDLAYPAGWAYQLLDCDRLYCKDCQTL
jgi:cysteine-rich repeat protein